MVENHHETTAAAARAAADDVDRARGPEIAATPRGAAPMTPGRARETGTIGAATGAARRSSRANGVAGVAWGAGVAAGASLALLAVRRRRQAQESFRDRTVLITGASRGLGLVLARLFAAEGAHVAILARDGAALADAAQDLRARGADVDAFVCDVTRRDEATRAVERLIARWGRIDVLVNNAGTMLSAPIEHTSVDDYEQAMAVHFWAPLHLVRAAVPHMRRQRGGRIVNIASIGGKVAVPHLLPYCASKFALVGLSDGLRAELSRDRIAVTTVCPGLMRTGSHLHARFRGHHKREFAWFALADALPLTSIDVERAAAQVVEAARHRRARLIIGTQAKALAWLDAMLPGAVATTMSMTNRLMPGPNGPEGNEEHTGFESRPRWMPRLVTRLADRAAAKHNELPVRPPEPATGT